MRFYQADPRPEQYWRGIILFGNNSASYKFALAQALCDLRQPDNDLVTLDTLAVPFVRHLCAHLKLVSRQGTSPSSKFLTACRQFNDGEITETQLVAITVKLGFSAVIEAFHKVNQAEPDTRFFIDERRANGGIRITDTFYHLTENAQFANLIQETEARWRLVEEAWELNLPPKLLNVERDENNQLLLTYQRDRRINIASCRNSLNGYQKGFCFYCFRPVSVISGEENLADVDHFLPWRLNQQIPNLNGVWNLVLACKECNRGKKGKSSHIPSVDLLLRLYNRNEYFINSYLPLRETLIRQTGKTPAQRHNFLKTSWETARYNLFHLWQPAAQGDSLF